MLLEFAHPPKHRPFRRAWRSSGACKVSGFLPGSLADDLSDIAERCYTAMAEHYGDDGIDPVLADHFQRWNGINHERLCAFLTRHDPALSAKWTTIQFTITQRFTDLFGSRWHPCPAISWFRRSIQVSNHLPWHADADAATSLGYGPCGINMWVPLTSVGIDAPSLEILPGSHRERDASSKSWNPNLLLGDVLLFDHFVLHRTQAMDVQKIRTSCEFRFTMTPPIHVRAIAHITRRMKGRTIDGGMIG